MHLYLYSGFMFAITVSLDILLYMSKDIVWDGSKLFCIGLLSFMGYFGAILAFPRKGR